MSAPLHKRKELSGPGPNHWPPLLLRCAWAILIAGLVNGCASKQPPAHSEIVERSIGAQTIRGAWAEATETGVVPDGWLASFNDPTMEAIVIEALRQNLELRAAATRLDAAAGFAIQAGAQMKPMMGVDGDAALGRFEGSDSTGSGGISLNVSWELDIWGRLRAIRSSAEEQLASVQMQYEFARESLAAQTAKAWYFASETRQQLDLAIEIVTVYQELVRVVKAKSEQGQVTPQDLNLARAELAGAQDRAVVAEATHKQAVRSLELLLGRYPSGEHEVPQTIIAVLPAVPAGVPAEVLERRPDMVAAEAEVRAAFHDVEAAKLARLPRLALTGSGGGSSSDMLDAVELGPAFFFVGANFLAPILTGGALDAEVTIQTADQEQSLANYGQRALTAFMEVESGLNNERLFAEREQFLKAAAAEYSAALGIARTRYDAGRISILDVLQMQARTNVSQSALIAVQHSRLAQRIDLHLALGGSFETPLPEATSAPAAEPAER